MASAKHFQPGALDLAPLDPPPAITHNPTTAIKLPQEDSLQGD